jgi:hypothetical protein
MPLPIVPAPMTPIVPIGMLACPLTPRFDWIRCGFNGSQAPMIGAAMGQPPTAAAALIGVKPKT